MKKKIISYITIAIILFGFAACSDDFLYEPPRKETIDGLIENPEEGAEKVIAAVYSKLYDWNVHSFSWIGISSITSDDADKGSEEGDTGADKHELDAWTFTPSSLSFREVWQGNYEGIGRAAYAIDLIDRMDLPIAEKKRYIAEAKMLRAYFYWNLVRMFGSVPLIKDVLSSSDEIDAALDRATIEQVYAFIEQDLLAAAEDLPTVIPASENGRVSAYAAQALLAKVYLYQKKWAESKQMCDAVMTGGFELLEDYAQIWRETGEFSKESIWEVNAIGTTPNHGIAGYFVVQAPRGAGGLGWGFNTPSQNLYDAYEPGDLRRDATIITSGDTLWDGYITNTAATNKYYNYKCYVSKTMETFNGDDNQTNKNLRIIRYGELLLISAEAENELGNIVAAQDALNQVRNRAGLANTTANNQADLREAIWKERRVEMAFEHDRTFDLRRTGRAGEILRALGINYVDGTHDLFPIPQTEIDLSNNRLLQNPGY